jgi:hypothetical protein
VAGAQSAGGTSQVYGREVKYFMKGKEVVASPKIENYKFGEIVIDGRRYSSDVIVYPDRIDSQWWRKEGHSLEPADVPEVLQAPPEVLVIGQGNPGRMDVPAETRRKLEETGIEVIVEPTTQACDTYNRLRGKRRVVAALHLTC